MPLKLFFEVNKFFPCYCQKFLGNCSRVITRIYCITILTKPVCQKEAMKKNIQLPMFVMARFKINSVIKIRLCSNECSLILIVHNFYIVYYGVKGPNTVY